MITYLKKEILRALMMVFRTVCVTSVLAHCTVIHSVTSPSVSAVSQHLASCSIFINVSHKVRVKVKKKKKKKKTGLRDMQNGKKCLSQIFMHQSFVTTSPTYTDGWGIAGLKCRAIFLLSWQCRGNDSVLMFRYLPQRDFLLREAGQIALF